MPSTPRGHGRRDRNIARTSWYPYRSSARDSRSEWSSHRSSLGVVCMSKNGRLFSYVRTRDTEFVIPIAFENIDARGDCNRTLLHEAIAFKRDETSISMISNKFDLESKDSLGRTPLHYAAAFGNYDVLVYLLKYGANPNSLDLHQNNPIWTAVLSQPKNYDIIRLLYKFGSDIDHKNKHGRSVRDVARQMDINDLNQIFQ